MELVGPASEAWRDAAANLPAAGPSADDCASLRIETDQQGARLVFVTRDGRRAERRLSQPDELLPALEALRVAGPSPAESAPGGAPFASGEPDAVPASPAMPASTASSAQLSGSEATLAALYTLLAGARAGQHALLSPVLSSALIMRIRRWELGASFAWEANYYQLKVPHQDRRRTLLTPSLIFARREPLGRIALLAGLRLGMALILPTSNQSFAYSAELPEPAWARLQQEGRLGTVLGVAVPREARVRFRAEASADLVWWDSQRAQPSTAPSGTFIVADTPRWAIACSVGMEFGGP